MMKQKKKSCLNMGGKAVSNIHDLSNVNFSDESDSDSNDDQVVMLFWNSGKVG